MAQAVPWFPAKIDFVIQYITKSTNNTMSEPRDALIVLMRILQEVPADQTEFREQLAHLGKNTLVYRAPELRDKFSTWSELDVIMKRHIPDAHPNNDQWKKNCIDIFVGTK